MALATTAFMTAFTLGQSLGNSLKSVFNDGDSKISVSAPDANPIVKKSPFSGLENLIDASKTSDSGVHFESGSNVTIYDSSLRTDGSASGNSSSGKNLGESLAGTLTDIGTTGIFLLAGAALVGFIILRK